MPDWVYELLEAFVAYMDRTTLWEALTFMVAGTIMVPLLVLIHEAGHALAAFALRRQVAELAVGDAPLLTVRVGGFRLRLGRITGEGDASGFVRYGGAQLGPRDTLVIALAGPLASLAGAVATGVAAVWAWPYAGISLLLGLATLGGLICCVGNLRVSGDCPASWSDGAWVRVAWRAMREPARVLDQA